MENKDVLYTRLVNEYMEKLFYFCLKKTGDRHTAEDLSQEIALCILSELHRGVKPTHFSAYVWRIARNRYARFAEKKHQEQELLSDADIGDLDLEGEDSPVDDMIHTEKRNSLRRELSFIASDYRELILSYYIEDKSIREIAKLLSIPEGTVKTRLFRARNQLKEGMNMARQFGKRSYKPENLHFTMSGETGRGGEPFSLANDLLSTNILLSAYDKPQSAEEIAIETGVALPYVQERLEKLVKGSLMKKTGDRYATKLYIMSGELQKKKERMTAEKIGTLTEDLISYIDLQTRFHAENGSVWHEGYQSYEDMKWTLLMFAVDELCKCDDDGTLYLQEEDMSCVMSDFSEHFTKRPNNGKWEFLGYESTEPKVKSPDFVGMHGCTSSVPSDYELPDFPRFWQYKFYYHRMMKATPEHLSAAEGRTLVHIAKRLPNPDEHLCEELVRYGYLKPVENGYVPTFYVADKAKIRPFTDAQKAELSAIAKRIKENFSQMNREIASSIKKEAPAHLFDTPRAINFAISVMLESDMRGAVLEEALQAGYIAYHDREGEAKDRMLGAYLSI